MSQQADAPQQPAVLEDDLNGVKRLTMNRPHKLNAWDEAMQKALFAVFDKARLDDATKAVILTGSGRFYSSGVAFGSLVSWGSPRTLHERLRAANQRLFDAFIEFPKPIVIAFNGPAIGATVTSATLCDYIVAAETAYFSTPFARLAIPPEGCSSLHFARIMGESKAKQMLRENWAPTAREALEIGLVNRVEPPERVLAVAQEVAESIVQQQKPRWISQEGRRAEYQAVNARESKELADACFDYPFLKAQYAFWQSKGKSREAALFGSLFLARPFWSLFL